jgi:acyl-CoA thioester hydrolase
MKTFSDWNIGAVIFEENTKYLKEITLGEQITIDYQLVGINQDGSRFHLRNTFRRGDENTSQRAAGSQK